MPAASADGECQARAQDLGVDQRAVPGRLEPQETRVGASALAESHDTSPLCAGLRREPREMFIIGGKNSHSTLLEPIEDLGFCAGDFGDRLEELDMDRRHPGYDRTMRPHEPSQRRNLAGMVHPDLEHPVGRVLGHPGKGKRHAPKVVV